MGPRAREGSTIWPFCVISWVPAVTSLRAAERRRFEQFSPVQWVDQFCGFAGADAFEGFPALQKLLDGLFKLLVHRANFLPSAAVGAPFHPVPILGPLFSPLNGSPASEAVFLLLRHGPL